MSKSISRRTFLRVAGQMILGFAGSGAVGWLYAAEVEPDWLQVERMDVPIANLPPEFEGFKLAHFSDLHLGPYLGGKAVARVVDRINRLRPDGVVFTGDFVSAPGHGELSLVQQAFSGLQAPHGVSAVLGNHDHWTDADLVSEAAISAGVHLLRNQRRLLEIGSGRLWLAGVDDIWEEMQDLDAALHDVPSNAPLILLAHEPDFVKRVAADGRVSLQLSGHSHGGQVRLPFLGPPILPYLGRLYPCGMYKVGGLWLYTNRGIGMISPAVRVNCRPEITLITLRAAI